MEASTVALPAGNTGNAPFVERIVPGLIQAPPQGFSVLACWLIILSSLATFWVGVVAAIVGWL